MASVLLTVLCCFFSTLLWSQNYPSILPYTMGDTLYVNAKSGLNFRSVAGKKGVVLTRLAFADIVIVRDVSPKYPASAADGILWAAVKSTSGDQGYIAAEYVSHLKPLPVNKIMGCEVAPYLTSVIENSEGLLCENEVVFDEGRLDDGKSFSTLGQAFYGRATTIEHSYGYEHHVMTIRSASISISAFYNLLDYLIAQRTNGCEDTFEGRSLKPEDLRLWRDYNYRISCEPLGLRGTYKLGDLVVTFDLVDL